MDSPLNLTAYKLFDKKVLSEEFIAVHSLSKKSLIDNKILFDHVKKSKKENLRLRTEHWYPDYFYFKLETIKHLTWLTEYFRDNYLVEFDHVIKNNSFSGIWLEKNESMNSHHHIDDWNYLDSPDISCIYCVDHGEEPCEVIFEYEYGRHKKRRYAVTLEKGRFVIFPSYLRHSITQNKNKKPFVAISTRWQNEFRN